MDEIATKRLANKDVELVTKLFPGTSNSCAKLVARFVKFFVEVLECPCCHPLPGNLVICFCSFYCSLALALSLSLETWKH